VKLTQGVTGERAFLDTTDGSTEGQSEAAEPEPQTPQVFVNYRRKDAASDARLVYERLATRFGAENVFLDVVDLQPGMKWLEEIKARGASCGVFIAVIGPSWMSSLTDRLQARFDAPTEDVARREIEFALSRGSGVEVVPVLVGDAVMPPADRLPRSIRALAAMQAVPLRHMSFDEDVERLIGALEQIQLRSGRPAATTREPLPPPESTTLSSRTTAAESIALRSGSPLGAGPIAPSPDERHYETVLRHMVDQGAVVPLLGSRVCGSLPDADEIAADLARRFELDLTPLDLAEVAQHVFVSSGRPDLHRTLRQILSIDSEPSAVHRFLARFPSELEQLGLPRRYQMILTTNYDSALERAFDAENEPYDLAVYMASGEDRGKFVHFPFDGDPEPVTVPNRYGKFPIDDYGEVDRTVIVKIHGGVDGSSGGYGWKENYVITEDHYIDYLSRSPVESLVPVQILAKLTESHCLFLGYTMRDWNLRVFLKRIWKGEPIGSKSWAIERDPHVLEQDFWRQSQVDLFASPLDEYVGELGRHMLERQEARA
jgi:hypothetical protein